MRRLLSAADNSVIPRMLGADRQQEHHFHAELITSATDGDTLWSAWHWTGPRADEAPPDMRGVALFRIEDGRIVSGRLKMEEVEEAGRDIDETVRGLTEGTRSQGE